MISHDDILDNRCGLVISIKERADIILKLFYDDSYHFLLGSIVFANNFGARSKEKTFVKVKRSYHL